MCRSCCVRRSAPTRRTCQPVPLRAQPSVGRRDALSPWLRDRGCHPRCRMRCLQDGRRPYSTQSQAIRRLYFLVAREIADCPQAAEATAKRATFCTQATRSTHTRYYRFAAYKTGSSEFCLESLHRYCLPPTYSNLLSKSYSDDIGQNWPSV